MSYKKPTNKSTKSGSGRVPSSVLGNQGSPAKIPVNHFKNKTTGKTLHRGNFTSKKAVSGPFNHKHGDN